MEKSSARLGILGGMGPQATQVFYQRVLDRTDARRDQEHVPALIWSDAGMPDRTRAILEGDREGLYPRMLAGARLLEREGCTVLAIPCNTAHYFADRLQSELDIPLLHMVRLAAAALAGRGYRRVGVLGTDGTVRSGLYQRELAALGIESVTPGGEAQKLVMSLIYDEIKRGERGSREKFAAVDRDLRARGCDGAILACTELSVYRGCHGVPEGYLDALDVLAGESIRACGYPLRNA